MSAHVEEWRTVPAQPDYEVSDLGRVRRATPGHSTNPGRVLKASIDGSGYFSVGAIGRVHVLVASAFLGPRPEGCHVDHLNRNRLDNRPCNLEYVTQRENNRRAAKLTAANVAEIQARRQSGETSKALGREFGVTAETVRFVCIDALRRSCGLQVDEGVS